MFRNASIGKKCIKMSWTVLRPDVGELIAEDWLLP